MLDRDCERYAPCFFLEGEGMVFYFMYVIYFMYEFYVIYLDLNEICAVMYWVRLMIYMSGILYFIMIWSSLVIFINE